jgi:GNAT superfamily N-acetyltransferase
VVNAYRTLGDIGDAFYEQQLRDVAGRAAHGSVLVAEVGGLVVGTVTYADGGSDLAEVADRDAATIRMLGVSPEARGRGVGEALVKACIDRARKPSRSYSRWALAIDVGHRALRTLCRRRNDRRALADARG